MLLLVIWDDLGLFLFYSAVPILNPIKWGVKSIKCYYKRPIVEQTEA